MADTRYTKRIQRIRKKLKKVNSERFRLSVSMKISKDLYPHFWGTLENEIVSTFAA